MTNPTLKNRSNDPTPAEVRRPISMAVRILCFVFGIVAIDPLEWLAVALMPGMGLKPLRLAELLYPGSESGFQSLKTTAENAEAAENAEKKTKYLFYRNLPFSAFSASSSAVVFLPSAQRDGIERQIP